METAVLPLAIAMVAGPQILSSIIFVTTKDPFRVSVAYLLGILLALITGVSLWYVAFNTLLPTEDISHSHDTALKSIQIVLVLLLIYLTILSIVQRNESSQPKWLKNLSAMQPKKAVGLGFLLILLFPSDFVVLATVGASLVRDHQDILAAVPFMLLTLGIAALPLILYLLFRRKMEVAMPQVRAWMETHSWIINICVYLLFIYLIL